MQGLSASSPVETDNFRGTMSAFLLISKCGRLFNADLIQACVPWEQGALHQQWLLQSLTLQLLEWTSTRCVV